MLVQRCRRWLNIGPTCRRGLNIGPTPRACWVYGCWARRFEGSRIGFGEQICVMSNKIIWIPPTELHLICLLTY